MIPQNLSADIGAGTDQFNPRPISLEEAFGRQNDRIGYLRSMGLPWAEAVFQLRDLLVGIEDDEFWDGIPQPIRASLPKLTKKKQEETRQKWSVEGWNGYPCRAYPSPHGPIYRPTAEQLSHAYQIVMRLANRKGLTWKKRRISGLNPGSGDPAEGMEELAEAI